MLSRAEDAQGRADRSKVLLLCLLCAVVSGVIVAAFLRGPETGDPSGESAPSQEASAESPPADEESTTTISDERSHLLDLPTDERVASVSFSADAGESTVVALGGDLVFEASTEDRRGAYVVFGVACGHVDGEGSGDSMTGTQNLLHEDPTVLRTNLLYTAEASGEHRCNATLRAPGWDPDFGDAELSADVSLRADEADGFAVTAMPDSEDPIVPPENDAVLAINETFDVPDTLSELEISATSHLTTCTGEGGSRDGTEENLCTEDRIDEDGSKVRVTSTVEVLDGGEVCRRVQIQDDLVEIDRRVHHLLHASAPRSVALTNGLCGDRIRLMQVIENQGPASLVVHRESSNVTLVGR